MQFTELGRSYSLDLEEGFLAGKSELELKLD